MWDTGIYMIQLPKIGCAFHLEFIAHHGTSQQIAAVEYISFAPPYMQNLRPTLRRRERLWTSAVRADSCDLSKIFFWGFQKACISHRLHFKISKRTDSLWFVQNFN